MKLNDTEGFLGIFSTLGLALLLTSQLFSALLFPVADCDEVYNFWEALHLLLFGRGLQTWEYSPVYALRSFAYVLVGGPYVPALLLDGLLGVTSKVQLFFTCRCWLGVLAALADWRLCSALAPRHRALFLLFKVVGPGACAAGSAFLPSTFAGWLVTLAYAGYLAEPDTVRPVPVVCIAAAALLGWPFAAVLGLPIVLQALTSLKNLRSFIKYSVLAGAGISLCMVLVDSFFYGRWTLAPLNIVAYNVLSSSTSSALYGTEPASFYALNLALNWNVVFVAAAVSPALPLLSRRFRSTPEFRVQLALFVWLAVFLAQPHKEERFLFPVFSPLCLTAAVVLDAALHRVSRRLARLALALFLTVFVVASLCRTAAVIRGYSAPLHIYAELAHLQNTNNESNTRVCVGKEWYRFPSSFFIPAGWQLDFVKSKFSGILPKHYQDGFSSNELNVSFAALANLTRRIPSNMNALNREETDRYVDVLTQCDYLVDLESDEVDADDVEPNFSQMTTKFEIVVSRRFLLAHKSHRFFRAFYVPLISDKFCTFGNYNLLRNLLIK